MKRATVTSTILYLIQARSSFATGWNLWGVSPSRAYAERAMAVARSRKFSALKIKFRLVKETTITELI